MKKKYTRGINFGKLVYSYVTDSKVELKKDTWPTKQETTQTTLGVIVVVIIINHHVLHVLQLNIHIDKFLQYFKSIK